MYSMILKEYFEENQGTAKHLNQALEENNVEEALQIIHKLKSSSGSIGAKRLYETATLLQEVLKGKDSSEIQPLKVSFSEMIEQILEEIGNLIEPL